MLSTRAANQLAPLVLRNGARTLVRRQARLPIQASAVSALLSHRFASTETSNRSSDGNYPPPGFNAEQAKKPLEQQKPTASQPKKADEPANPPDVSIPASEPSEHPPTTSEETATLDTLANEKKAHEKAAVKKEEEKKKLTLGQRIMKEVHHYWDGTKLLGTEIKISSKLALKMGAGYELTRREHRQLQRTVVDLGRLVPFSMFVLVPFAELLLPVALKLFPNMLPSTYEDSKTKEGKATLLRKSRKEVSTFLRGTLRETGIPISAANAQKQEFTDFFRKIRTTGEQPTKADVVKVCKLFKDDLTLDNLSRPQLVGICRYMSLSTFGTDAMLRYTVRHRMRQIKRDDRAISYEGVDSLSVPELQTACASRGLRTHGMSPARLRDDLALWLDLRLKYGVPSTLLVLSNAFMYTQGKEAEFDSLLDALQAVLSSIPEELFHEIELEVHNAEGAATNKQRLEVLKEQQELIQEEAEQNAERGGEQVPSDREDIDEGEEEVKKQENAMASSEAADQTREKVEEVKEEVKKEEGKVAEKEDAKKA